MGQQAESLLTHCPAYLRRQKAEHAFGYTRCRPGLENEGINESLPRSMATLDFMHVSNVSLSGERWAHKRKHSFLEELANMRLEITASHIAHCTLQGHGHSHSPALTRVPMQILGACARCGQGAKASGLGRPASFLPQTLHARLSIAALGLVRLFALIFHNGHTW